MPMNNWLGGWNIFTSDKPTEPLVGSDGKLIPQDFIADVADGDFEVIEAAEGEATGPEKIRLMANSGVPMRVPGFFDPVIIDISGARFANKKTPIIADHDTRQRIGHATQQAIVPAGGNTELGGKAVKGPLIGAMGIRSSESRTAKEFVADSKGGFPFQVSIGARIVDGSFVAEGDKVEVNGKTFKGPLIVAHKSLIRELSVTVLGADGNTSAKIAAKAQLPSSPEENDMDFNAYVRSLHLDPDSLTAEQKTALEAQWKSLHPQGGAQTPVQASGQSGVTSNVNATEPTEEERLARRRELEAAEDTRVGSIRATATRYEDSVETLSYGGRDDMPFIEARQTAIRDGHDPRDFELACLRAARPTPGGPAVHSINRDDYDNDVLSAAILRLNGNIPMRETNIRSGREFGLETMFKPEVLEASHGPQYQVRHISHLFDLQIRAAGKYYSGLDRSGSDFQAMAVQAWNEIKASGFSTLNITNVLENTMHKSALAAFGAAEGVWRFICGRRNLSDFRPHNLYRLRPDGQYRQVGVTGELKHVSMTDEKYTIQADTYGAMITIDRKTRKNDDLGMVVDQARGLGTLGAQRIEESVFVLLLSNPGSFFSVGNGNLLSGATSTLGDLDDGEGLDAARLLFRNQVVNGKPTNVSPRILLTGTGLETTANRLWNEESWALTGDTDSKQFVRNPHKGLYRPVISPYLNNTAITDEDGAALSGQSATQWFLLADPSSPLGCVICIGFMDGQETPHFDEAETQFNVPDGIQMRSYLDWGVAMHVTELGVKSAGA